MKKTLAKGKVMLSKYNDELPSLIVSEMVSTIPCSIVRHVHSAATPLGKSPSAYLKMLLDALVALGN